MTRSRIVAIVEVAVVLGLVLGALAALHLSPLGVLERRVTPRPFLEYAWMMMAPFLLLAVTRRPAAAYGLTPRGARGALDAALKGLAPVALAQALIFGIAPRDPALRWLICVAVTTGLLLVLGRILRDAPGRGVGAAIALFTLLPIVPDVAVFGRMTSTFVFYVVFLGPGEEALFRGYVQSRLDEAFPPARRFAGADWGWGLILASLLFGLFHVVNLPALVAGRFAPDIGVGLRTLCWGLVFGWVRARTGSVLAPALLHGVPQGVAFAFLGR